MEIVKYIDIVIVVIYFIAILGIGLMAGRKVTSSNDFALAGGQLKFPMLLGTLIATAVGAASSLGRAGKAYEFGILIALSGIAYGLGLLFFSYLAPILKRIGYWSVPDALGVRFGKVFRVISAFIIILALIGLFGSQLIALGITSSMIMSDFNVDYKIAVIVSAFIMTTYTMFGGIKSVAATDLIQVVIILLVIGLILPILLVIELGGPIEAVKNIYPTDGNWLGGMSVMYLISLFLIDIPIVLVDASLWQKTGAAQSIKHIRKAAIISAFVFMVWGILTSALGVFAHVLLPDLLTTDGGADSALPALILNYVPVVVKGFSFAALIAIMVSTASTALLVAGTTVGFEVLKSFKPSVSDKSILLTTRLTIVFIAIAGVFIAINVRGVFDLLLLAMAIYVAGLFVPTMCALFWKQATTLGALFASIGGAVTVVWLYALKSSGILIAGMEPIVGALLVCGFLMYVVSLITYNEKSKTKTLYEASHKKDIHNLN
jgi:Na+/proline symporter